MRLRGPDGAGGVGEASLPRPEVLAPAGDAASLRAALASGADAVYFGLDEGFNARARAANFRAEELEETVRLVHRAGAKAYLALNTLVFEPELPAIERLVKTAARAGVDALIVQDPAVALVARALAPSLAVHASTQMTVADAGAARLVAGLGVTRVVLPRELSVSEIRRFAAESPLETEVFVHGALCVAWSGQCLTSEAWGGRSANRGQCAQSCRMPYGLVLDGARRDLDELRYLLSPKDLLGLRAVADLSALGVAGLKIEGRQKGPHYVATATAAYRRQVDRVLGSEAAGPEADAALARDLQAMSLAYSRGFSEGFLGGSDHQTLVEGRFPKHRGIYLGRVTALEGRDVLVHRDEEGRPWTGDALGGAARSGPCGDSRNAGRGGAAVEDVLRGAPPPGFEPRPGMGVVFDQGDPERKDEPGGPVFRVESRGDALVLGFGRPGPDLAQVRPGDRVWVTSDPAALPETERAIAGAGASGRIAILLRVAGEAGRPLEVEARIAGRTTPPVRALSETLLEPSRGPGLDHAILAPKLGAFGGTTFHLGALDATALARGLHLPVSELKRLRRRVAEALVAAIEDRRHPVSEGSCLPMLRAGLASLAPRPVAAPGAPLLVPLCRNLGHLEAAIAAGVSEVELEWMELVGLERAAARARAAGLRVVLAGLRVQKPGEEGFAQALERLEPDGLLVRHLGALGRARGAVLHGDFSLNAANSLAAGWLLDQGLATLTPAFDLDAAQLAAWLDAVPQDRVTMTVQHRVPTFHTEHCVYAHLLSAGRDFHTCGRPCERHEIALEDHEGRVHPVIVDAGCRNTVFNAEVQSAAALVPGLLARGVRRFRVELVRESPAAARAILDAWSALLAGNLAPGDLVRRLGTTERLGLTDRAMAMMSV